MAYLAVDPGKSNGVAVFNDAAQLVFMGVIQEAEFSRWLADLKFTPKVAIVEDFVLYPHKAKDQTYSNMVAVRMIGRMEYWAHINNVELVKQPAHLKSMGYRYLGEKPAKNQHAKDALVHGLYYLIRHGIMSTKDIPSRQ